MIKKNAKLNTQLKKSTKQVTKLNEDLVILRTQAETDALTGLANRRFLWKELEKTITAADTNKKPLCVLVFDIDYFKHFNDTYGHLVGDQVIKFLARTISYEIKKTDTAARFGGDEFTVILPNTPVKTAMTCADNIRKIISAKKLINKSTGESLGKITLSIGAAIYRAGETSDDFFDRADTALFASKTAGRDRVMLAADVVKL
jgi:diguanylate cyclase